MGSPRAPLLLANQLNKTLDPHPSQDPQTVETQRSDDQEVEPNNEEEEPKESDDGSKQVPLQITKKPQSRAQRAFAPRKLQSLAENFNPIPFSPSKTLDFSRHGDLFRALNLWDFVNLDLSFDVCSNPYPLMLLVANYNPLENRSFVHNVEVSVSRLDLAKALKLPLGKEGGETQQAVFSKDESKDVILEFLSHYVLLEDEDEDEMSIMAEEAVAAVKMVKEGKANEVDWVGLVWALVERDILDAPRSGICRYASHLTCLMRCQQPVLFEKEAVLGLDAGISVPEPMEDDDSDKEDGGYLEEFHKPALSLGTDNCGCLMDGAEDRKGGEERNWVDEAKDEDGGFEHCLRRCNSNEARGMEFEDLCRGDEFSNLERLPSTDLLHDVEGVRVPYCPRMNSLDQNDEDFLLDGVGGNKHASSSLLCENNGKRHIDSLHNSEDDNGHFHQDNRPKRMRYGGVWAEQAPSGFDSYMEQIQRTTEEAKMVYAEKERACLDAHLQLQYLNEMIEQKDLVIQTLQKTRAEENRTWQHDVNRYEQDLNVLANLVIGYKKALKETQNKFEEYRKKCPEGDEPLYMDVGESGGLVLSSRELERMQSEKEEAMRQRAEEMVEAFQCYWFVKFNEYTELVVMLHRRVVDLDGEVKLIKERFAKREVMET